MKPLTTAILVQSFLDVALSQLGVEEQPRGSNSGPQINQYLRSVGLGAGFSWCMSFVYWCAQQAAERQGKANPLYKTGGVLDQWYKSKQLRVAGLPKSGDIFIMDFGSGLGHTGIVKNVGPTRIDTIEGNATLLTGSREGYQVCQKNRAQSAMLGYLRTGL